MRTNGLFRSAGLALLLAACGADLLDPTVGADANEVPDAGGVAKSDAAIAEGDAGAEPPDAGSSEADAGLEEPDSGLAEHDAGNVEPDAGSSAADAGDSFAAQFIAAHNQVRAEALPAPQPALPALQWNTAAAQVAQAWADGCQYGHNPNRGDYGENIAASAPPRDQPPAWVVEQWAAESADYAYATNDCASGAVCGHYTQLVWRATTSVGCATKVCSTNSPFGPEFRTWQLWVCDYAPPGNYVGQRPY